MTDQRSGDIDDEFTVDDNLFEHESFPTLELSVSLRSHVSRAAHAMEKSATVIEAAGTAATAQSGFSSGDENKEEGKKGEEEGDDDSIKKGKGGGTSGRIKIDYRLVHGNRDIYYRKAKELGFRARSAFKLMQLDDQCNIFEGVQRAVDLCAAPGSWSQVLARRLYQNNNNNNNGNNNNNPSIPPGTFVHIKDFDIKKFREEEEKKGVDYHRRIVSVDIQEMAPLDGVIAIQGDITNKATADAIIELFDRQLSDIVVCDGAPDVTGLHEIDEYIHAQLLLAALNITTHILRTGGIFVAKMFKGDSYPLLLTQLQLFFSSVQCIKPLSSRIRSAEHFVVCKGFSIPSNYRPAFFSAINPDTLQGTVSDPKLVGYLACGDLGKERIITTGAEKKEEKDSNNNNNNNSHEKEKVSNSYLRFLSPATNSTVSLSA